MRRLEGDGEGPPGHARCIGERKEAWRVEVWGGSSSQCYFAAVVKSENPALLRWWLDKLCEWRPDIQLNTNTYRRRQNIQSYSSLAAQAFSTGSPEMYAEWEDFLLDPARQLRSSKVPGSVYR